MSRRSSMVCFSIVSLMLSAQSGCGALLDTGYLLASDHYTDVSAENKPTGQREERIEYQIGPQLDLQCWRRTRSIDTSVSVSKTLEYRGGFSRTAYGFSAGLDGAIGLIAGGSLLGICAKTSNNVSCRNLLWVSPIAVDMLYSLIRYKTVRPPVLTKKHSANNGLFFGQALEERQTECEEFASLWLGSATGPSPTARLNQGGGERVLRSAAVAISVGDDQRISLDANTILRWAQNTSLNLWVKDIIGHLHQVQVDRCTVLRPFVGALATADRQSFDRSCQLPSPIN